MTLWTCTVQCAHCTFMLYRYINSSAATIGQSDSCLFTSPHNCTQKPTPLQTQRVPKQRYVHVHTRTESMQMIESADHAVHPRPIQYPTLYPTCTTSLLYTQCTCTCVQVYSCLLTREGRGHYAHMTCSTIP